MQSLQSIVSRRITALEPAVVSVTIFDAGSALNVIPGAARLGGTAGSFSPEIRKLLEESIRGITQSTAKAFGCGVKLIGSRAIHQRLIMLMSRQGRYPSHQTFWERRISL